MKRLFTLLSAVALAALMGSNSASAGVVGSDHDMINEFGGTGTALTTTEVCVFCHTPHNSKNPDFPLWNRTESVASYTMYTSPTLDMTIAGTPQGVSAACLSCHDGTIAVDTVAGYPFDLTGDGVGTYFLSGHVLKGPDLRNQHPISLTYDPTQDPNFHAIATVQGSDLKLYGASNDQVECASCHNPHDTTNDPFLRMSNDGSDLCLTCHNL